MPTIRAKNPKLADVDLAADVVGARGAAGSPILVNMEEGRRLSDILFCTGSRRSSLLEAIDELRSVTSSRYGFSVAVPTSSPTLGPNGLWHRCFAISKAATPSSPTQGGALGLSPLVRSQVEQIVNRVSSKLRERLSLFESNRRGLEPVSSLTKSAVNDLVTWLSTELDTVSATVSKDGMLSIAAVFSSDVRLYVEIERDGNAGAVISRSRIHAEDLPVTAVSQLTKEMVLDAVGGS